MLHSVLATHLREMLPHVVALLALHPFLYHLMYKIQDVLCCNNAYCFCGTVPQCTMSKNKSVAGEWRLAIIGLRSRRGGAATNNAWVVCYFVQRQDTLGQDCVRAGVLLLFVVVRYANRLACMAGVMWFHSWSTRGGGKARTPSLCLHALWSLAAVRSGVIGRLVGLLTSLLTDWLCCRLAWAYCEALIIIVRTATATESQPLPFFLIQKKKKKKKNNEHIFVLLAYLHTGAFMQGFLLLRLLTHLLIPRHKTLERRRG